MTLSWFSIKLLAMFLKFSCLSSWKKDMLGWIGKEGEKKEVVLEELGTERRKDCGMGA